MGCRAEIHTWACLTASQHTTIWATLHPSELRCTLPSYDAPYMSCAAPAYLPHNPKQTNFSVSYLFFYIVNLLFEKLCFVFETVLIFLGIYSGVSCYLYSCLFFHIVNLPFEKLCFVFETVLIFLGIYSGVPCLILTELLLDTAVATSHPSTTREKIIAKNFYILFLKGHGNEADFLGFLHKTVRHRSITLLYISSRSDFGFEFAEIFVIEKRLPNSPSRGVGKNAYRYNFFQTFKKIYGDITLHHWLFFCQIDLL
jgi:hypothetical protein